MMNLYKSIFYNLINLNQEIFNDFKSFNNLIIRDSILYIKNQNISQQIISINKNNFKRKNINLYKFIIIYI